MRSDYSLTILYLPKFIRLYRRLPKEAQGLAEKKEIIFRQNPFDSRLNTHKLHGILKGFWSFYIDHKYRIIFEFSKDKRIVYFHSVGDHNIYQ